MSDADRVEGVDCVVVGGGLAGLACAHGLARAGRSVTVVEADEDVGGRARTVWHRGKPVDRGVQVLLAGYPRTRELVRAVGLPRRDLRPVSGAVFVGRGPARRLGTSAPGVIRFGGLSWADRGLLAKLAGSVVGRRAEDLLDPARGGRTAEECLRAYGFSEAAREGFLRPLFGSVALDRSLSFDEGYLRFLVAMLARGPARIPSDGMGMLAEWTAAAIRQAGGAVELGCRVSGIELAPGGRRSVGVRVEDGRIIPARYVVLAVDAPAARGLLAPVDGAAAERIPREWVGAASVAFALARPLYRGRALVINTETADDARERVDLVCQTSNITRPGAGEGPHILVATRACAGAGGAEGLVEAMGGLVRRWAPRFDWDGLAEPIGVFEHPFAQFRPLVGVRAGLPGPRTAVENVILAGDLTGHPSIEGAVASGTEAARIVGALIP